MIIYFIKAVLCAFFFLFIYMILFERENMHRFKRHYLLWSLILSFTIPSVEINIVAPQLNEEVTFLINRIYSESNIVDLTSQPVVLLTETPTENNISTGWSVDFLFLAKVLYIIVVIALFLRLSKNLYSLLYYTKRGRHIVHNNRKLILIRENLVPFSFGTCIYINEDDHKNGSIAEDMIRHEQAHIDQRHSLDIIFIELLIAVFWFNPALYLYRRKIKQNHEFLADEAVLKINNDVAHYQNILISIISKNGSTGLASSLNYSTIKKRFIMMKKETSQRKARYKKIMTLPVILLAICMFSTHTIANEPPTIPTESANENKPQEEDFIIPGKGVSDELNKEYQSIVDKYLEDRTELENRTELKWKTFALPEKDILRLYTIYVQMTEEQQGNQLINMMGPFSRLNKKKRSPNNDEWNSAKRANILWFEGKRANASELEKYNRNDIYFFINNIDEEKKVYQSALWTNKGYDAYIEQYKDKIPLSVLLEIKPQVWYKTGIKKK